MFFLLALLPLASSTCLHGTTLHPRALGPVQVSKFSYTGLRGPQNWASLAPENLACSTGTTQSPINIDSTIGVLSEPPVLNIPSVESAEFENLGSTIEVIVNGTTTVAGEDVQLKQFHFHAPSEHRIEEEFFPLEMHMVHESSSGAITVLAILFQLTPGPPPALLSSVITNLDSIASPGSITTTGALDFVELKTHLETTPLREYTGSLTTPPCKEGVRFLVTQVPMGVDVETFNRVKGVVRFNARFTQNILGGRNILGVAADGVRRVEGGATGTAGVSPPVESAPLVEVPESDDDDVEDEADDEVAGDEVEAPEADDFVCLMGACVKVDS